MTDPSTRAARFAAAYALLRMAADLGDHWIIAAKTVSTMSSVAVLRLATEVGCLLPQGVGVAVVRRHRLASRFALVGGR